jgi:integrase
MRKTALRLKKTRINGDLYWQVTVPQQGGGRVRRTFKDRNEAQTFLDLSKVQVENHGKAALSISDKLRVMATEAERKLAPYGKTIRDAVEHYLAHLKSVAGSKPVREVVAALIQSKQADGASSRYLGDLHARLSRFAVTFGERMIAGISTAEIDGWLRNLGVSGLTRNSYRLRLSILFSFAESNHWLVQSPIEKVTKAKVQSAPCGILTPAQISALLHAATLETLPYWAIGAFAGLRSAEIERLEWQDLDFESGIITVAASKAKTASRRIIEMAENLRAWLAPYAGNSGPVCPTGLRKKLEADRARAGITDWPNNALRHSFGSYRLAATQNAAQTSMEMGNSPQMVFRHYRELVKPKTAAQWWSIAPAAAENVIALKA